VRLSQVVCLELHFCCAEFCEIMKPREATI
jgi:hypothetical protein